MAIGPRELQTLLTLPSLKSLDIALVSIPHSVDLPKTINLSHLRMELNYPRFNVESICSALKKMPKLKILELRVDVNFHSNSHFNLDRDDDMLHLVCKVLVAEASQAKLIVVKQMLTYRKSVTLKIVRKNHLNFNVEDRTLNLVLFANKTSFIERVKAFAEEKLHSHHAVLVEDNSK